MGFRVEFTDSMKAGTQGKVSNLSRTAADLELEVTGNVGCVGFGHEPRGRGRAAKQVAAVHRVRVKGVGTGPKPLYLV